MLYFVSVNCIVFILYVAGAGYVLLTRQRRAIHVPRGALLNGLVVGWMVVFVVSNLVVGVVLNLVGVW